MGCAHPGRAPSKPAPPPSVAPFLRYNCRTAADRSPSACAVAALNGPSGRRPHCVWPLAARPHALTGNAQLELAPQQMTKVCASQHCQSPPRCVHAAARVGRGMPKGVTNGRPDRALPERRFEFQRFECVRAPAAERSELTTSASPCCVRPSLTTSNERSGLGATTCSRPPLVGSALPVLQVSVRLGEDAEG